MRAPRPAALQKRRRTVAVQKAVLPGGLHRALRVQRHPGRAAGAPGQAAVIRRRKRRRTVAVQKAGLPGGLHRALRVQRHPGRAAGVPGQAAVTRVGKQAYSTRSSLWMS